MHAPTVDFPSVADGNIINLANIPFSNTYNQLKISELIQEKIHAREYFYGIEITPGLKEVLNYNLFTIAPLFTSIVWIATHNLAAESADQAPALRLAKRIESNGPVLSHISCQNMTSDKLRTFLKPSVNNVMVIRGDIVENGQQFQHAVELVKEVRNIRKDNICISVGGYPEMHPEATSREDDLRYLKEKVEAGADLLITQLTFSEDALIDFIRNCRRVGITIPILPGIYVPTSWPSLKFVTKLTKVKVPKELYFEYRKRRDNQTEFQAFGVQQAVKMINSVFNNDLGVYGVQFFTLNCFKNIEKVVQEVFN